MASTYYQACILSESTFCKKLSMIKHAAVGPKAKQVNTFQTFSDENILCHQNIKNIVSSKFPDFSLIFEKIAKFPDFSLTGKRPSNFP